MGLKSTIQGLVQEAITKSLGDLASTITVKSVSTGAYDPVTGVAAQTTTSHTARCVIVGIRQEESTDIEIVRDGKRALVPTKELEGVDIDALDDIVVVDGIEYQLKAVTLDPSGALYKFTLIGRQKALFDGVY